VKFSVSLAEKGLKRDGSDLHYDIEIDVIEAILGTEKELNIPII
jgi:DnaJ-class molecular chaperone